MGMVLLGLAVLAVLTAVGAYVCFYLACRVPRERTVLPLGHDCDPYRPTMDAWTAETRQLPHRAVAITSFDGLRLTGKFYEYALGAPVELLLHGYRGTAERDLCGGVQRCFRLGHSALLIDQRGCSTSEGRTITFGVLEQRDCLAWLDFLIQDQGPEVPILLGGISMGATTALLCAGQDLPPNVKVVLADCGYASAPAIIRTVLRQMHLPGCLYHLVRLGGRLYGGFDLNDADVPRVLAHSKLPVLFFHGLEDTFVPWTMSRDNYEAHPGPKKLVTVPQATHGLSYLLDGPGYLRAMAAFCAEHGLPARYEP